MNCAQAKTGNVFPLIRPPLSDTLNIHSELSTLPWILPNGPLIVPTHCKQHRQGGYMGPEDRPHVTREPLSTLWPGLPLSLDQGPRTTAETLRDSERQEGIRAHPAPL